MTATMAIIASSAPPRRELLDQVKNAAIAVIKNAAFDAALNGSAQNDGSRPRSQ
ncbi:MAG: hypothetical protein ACT4OU_13065 [Hyphomicrobium sp.]